MMIWGSRCLTVGTLQRRYPFLGYYMIGYLVLWGGLVDLAVYG